MRLNYRLALFLVCICCLFCGCGQKKTENHASASKIAFLSKTDSTGRTILTRFRVPQGFIRISADSTSFASYLRNLPLKPKGALVSYFDGAVKTNQGVYEAVIDLPIGKRDLHQCADAVIRLRADYFFQNKSYDSIHFNFTNGFKADYMNWRQGKRIVVEENRVFWRQSSQPSDSPKSFWNYLEMVFSYAGTASLEREMKSVSLEEIRIGDVFIKGGFPGHAVIVVDMAIDKTSNKKVFLLAQSYMPAQELQILNNPNNSNLSPWYGVSEISNSLHTPEWTFKRNDLRRF